MLNGEPELLQLLQDVLALGDHVTWAVDMAGREPAFLLALLTGHGQDRGRYEARWPGPQEARRSRWCDGW
ncbi:hypothetical protein [Streptomyces sp. NPDC051704]|uniref:hypothetical protein n=1 Tax=Streptomyces sp. NPDC051704 TaxID=3365671 RepID=UPI0037A3DC17